MTHRGSCHCGAVRFRFESEPITKAYRCNCSICWRKGAVVSTVYYAPDAITVEGTEFLKVYLWGDNLVNHYFCGQCGIYPFHDVKGKEGHYRVNLNCVEGVDWRELDIEWLDGRSF